jgi:hypothetical protein
MAGDRSPVALGGIKKHDVCCWRHRFDEGQMKITHEIEG